VFGEAAEATLGRRGEALGDFVQPTERYLGPREKCAYAQRQVELLASVCLQAIQLGAQVDHERECRNGTADHQQVVTPEHEGQQGRSAGTVGCSVDGELEGAPQQDPVPVEEGCSRDVVRSCSRSHTVAVRVDDRQVPVACEGFEGRRARQLPELRAGGEKAGQSGSVASLGAPRGLVTTRAVKGHVRAFGPLRHRHRGEPVTGPLARREHRQCRGVRGEILFPCVAVNTYTGAETRQPVAQECRRSV
jgi:hypothetical protein